MEWLGSNWIWLALGAGFVAFFALGRGGCGMGHGGDRHEGPRETASTTGQSALAGEHARQGGPAQGAGQGHRHGCC